jgi:ComF family protein
MKWWADLGGQNEFCPPSPKFTQTSMLTDWLEKIIGKTCIYCFRAGDYICQQCRDVILEPYNTEVNVQNVDSTVIAYRYNSPLERFWSLAKHQGYFRLALFAGELMRSQFRSRLHSYSDKRVLLVPVPLAEQKRRQRGFNQTELMIEGLLRSAGPASFRAKRAYLLVRRRQTQTQIGKNRQQRLDNLKDTFIVNKEVEEGTPNDKKSICVVLIDDITTTGATLAECAQTLRENGYENIDALVFAKA